MHKIPTVLLFSFEKAFVHATSFKTKKGTTVHRKAYTDKRVAKQIEASDRIRMPSIQNQSPKEVTEELQEEREKLKEKLDEVRKHHEEIVAAKEKGESHSKSGISVDEHHQIKKHEKNLHAKLEDTNHKLMLHENRYELLREKNQSKRKKIDVSKKESKNSQTFESLKDYTDWLRKQPGDIKASHKLNRVNGVLTATWGKSEEEKSQSRSDAMKGNKNAFKGKPDNDQPVNETVEDKQNEPEKIVVPDDRRINYEGVKAEGIKTEEKQPVIIPKPKKDWKPRITESKESIHIDYSDEPVGTITIPDFKATGFTKFTKKELEMKDVSGPIQDAVNMFERFKQKVISNREKEIMERSENRIKNASFYKTEFKGYQESMPKIDGGYQIINGKVFLRVNVTTPKYMYGKEEKLPEKIPMEKKSYIIGPNEKEVEAGQSWRDEIKVQRGVYVDANGMSEEDQILMNAIHKAPSGKMHEFFQKAEYDEVTNTIESSLNTKKYQTDPDGINIMANMTVPRYLHLLAHYNAKQRGYSGGYVVPEKNLPRAIQEQISIYREDNRAYGERMSSSYYEAYLKGLETSFGEKNAKDTLKSEYGVRIKRQNGKEMTDDEVQMLKKVIDHTYNSMGNPAVLKKFAEEKGLKISFSGSKNAFLRKAVGLYVPTQSTVVVGPGMREIMPHEMAHFYDDVIGGMRGEEQGYRNYYASEMPNTDIGMLTAKGRRSFTSDKSVSGNYWKRSCEVFARLVEQYAAINDGNERYYSTPGYWPKEKFDKLKPEIESVLMANLGKSFRDLFPIRIPEVLFFKAV